ncbi:gpW [compost metagenome]
MTACLPISPEVLRARLAEAESAYHSLTIGGQARVIVDQNGERVEFAPANAGRLMAYIQDLRRQLGCGGTSGPMMVLF